MPSLSRLTRPSGFPKSIVRTTFVALNLTGDGLVPLRHKFQKPSNVAAFEGSADGLFYQKSPHMLGLRSVCDAVVLDDPDQNFYENYVCGAEGNYNGYCNSEVDQLVEQQSREPDQDKRKSLVWAIEKRL